MVKWVNKHNGIPYDWFEIERDDGSVYKVTSSSGNMFYEIFETLGRNSFEDVEKQIKDCEDYLIDYFKNNDEEVTNETEYDDYPNEIKDFLLCKSFLEDLVKTKRSSLLITNPPDESGFNSNPNEDDTTFSFSNFSTHFDEHIDKSIRGYSTLRKDVVSISKFFVEENTTVLDLGCSQGSLLRSIYENNTHVTNTQYLGVDVDVSFKTHWESDQNSDEDRLNYVVDVITTMEFPKNLSMVVSLFTFQFIPERERVPLMEKIYDNLVEGGSFVFSEKLLSVGGKVQNMMEFLYYDHKKQHFTEKQIMDKEVELRHLSKLITEDQLTTQLNSIGFQNIECFWRNHNFIGLTMTKGSDCEIKL